MNSKSDLLERSLDDVLPESDDQRHRLVGLESCGVLFDDLVENARVTEADRLRQLQVRGQADPVDGLAEHGAFRDFALQILKNK